MREPIATWNSARGAWERPETSMLCGHQVPFSETWPTSGMTRSGRLYPLPTRGLRIAGSASSSSPGLLPTPAAGNFNDGESVESWETRRQANLAKGINGNGQGTPLAMAVQLLKTPTAQLAVNGGSQHPDKRREGGHGPTLADQIEHLLPTPQAHDAAGSKTPEQIAAMRARGHGVSNLNEAAAHHLLPTPRASDGTKGGPNQRGSSGDLMLPSAVMDLLPTPAARDWRSGRSNIMDRNARPLSEVVEMTLQAHDPEAVALLPTPRCADGLVASTMQANRDRLERGIRRRGTLEEEISLMPGPSLGDLTARPSADGKASSDAQHPGQLSLGELASG